MAAATECPSCGAADATTGSACPFCGAGPGVAAERPRTGLRAGAPREVIPGDLPPAPEARRIRGLAVPLVAALLVVGIGYPLTALAVTLVGRSVVQPSESPEGSGEAFLGPSSPGVPVGRARLTGAVTFNGPATPLGCQSGAPKLVTFGSGAEAYSLVISVPAGSAPGTYPLSGTTFVAVNRTGGSAQTWTSLRRPNAMGTISLGADRSLSARFSGLEGAGAGLAGTVEGTVEVRCG